MKKNKPFKSKFLLRTNTSSRKREEQPNPEIHHLSLGKRSFFLSGFSIEKKDLFPQPNWGCHGGVNEVDIRQLS